MFNFLRFFAFLKPISHKSRNSGEMEEIVYQPVNLKNLSLTVKYLRNLSDHNVYLCRISNRSKKFDLALSDQKTLQNMLNKSKSKLLNSPNGKLAKFEQFTMSKLQCEFAIDEHLPRKVYRAGIKIECFLFNEKFSYVRIRALSRLSS